MAVDIIPKTAEKTPLWQNAIFYFSIFLIVATVAGYFLINNDLKKANKKSDELKGTIDKGRTDEQAALEKRVFSYKYRIDGLSELLDGRLMASSFFNFLEQNTRPEIWLKEIKIDPQRLRAVISGEGESFQTIGQQIAIFKNGQNIKDLKINNISINTSGKIDFGISFSFNNQFFKKTK
jgi:hypothetical protein